MFVLEVYLNFSANANYKYNSFFKNLLKKSIKFFSNKEKISIIFGLIFLLLLAKVDLISEKQSHKKDVFLKFNNSYVKIIFKLSIEILALYT